MIIKIVYNQARRGFAEWMRKMADRIGPEDSFAGAGINFYFRNRVGMVITSDLAPDSCVLEADRMDGVGVHCWYRRSDYDERRFGDEQVADTLTRFHELIHKSTKG